MRLAELRDHPEDHAALARTAAARRDWDAVIKHSAHLREHHANLDVAKNWAATYDRLMKHAAPLATLDAKLDERAGLDRDAARTRLALRRGRHRRTRTRGRPPRLQAPALHLRRALPAWP